VKRKNGAPGFVPPMLATRVRELPEGTEWEYEVKWDGYRIEAVKDGTSVRLLSRRGSDYSQRFRSVAKAVADIAAESAVLDGEVVAVDAKGQPSFQVLQNRGRLPEGYRLSTSSSGISADPKQTSRRYGSRTSTGQHKPSPIHGARPALSAQFISAPL